VSAEREREPERDPELARTLALALASPSARPGAEQRVARRLEERLFATPRGWPAWAVLGACALCVAAGVLLGPRLLRAPAPPSATTAPHSWLALRAARAALDDKATLRVEHDDERGTELELSAGTALFHVKKGTGRSFVVNAGSARVEVVGTVFAVALAKGRPSVEVLEGVVRYTNGGVTQSLRAGESAPAGTHLFALAPAELARLRAPVNVAGPTVPAPPAASDAAPAASDSPAASAPAVVPAAPSPNSAAAKPRESAATERNRAAPPAAAAALAAPADAYQRARALERQGSLAEAASAYAAIAAAGGADAEDAAFALARLPAQHGDPNAALGAIAKYRAEFPAGRYARDIDVLELNAHLATHDDDAATRDADAFLAHFGNDARAWRFRVVRATGRARAGDCDGARSALEHVPDGAAKTAALAPCLGR